MWSYEGDNGPESWGRLDPVFTTCEEGMEQSPIDIPADAPVNADDVVYAYRDGTVAIVNDNATVRVEYPAGSSVWIDGVEYTLQQFHFHGPSEHTIAGEHRDMEMHLVHTDADDNILVIGVLIVTGGDNQAFAPVLHNLPDQAGVTINGVVVNATSLLPTDRRYVAYLGSLTTPPCAEGVTWHVLVTPVKLSADQVLTMRAIQPGTNRPVQPMNDRGFIVKR
jgi:carbonic anhydrase